MAMFQNKAKTVSEYLEALPAARREVAGEVLALVRRNIPKGYREEIAWGAITWSVPLEVLPDTYNGHALTYAALSTTKSGFSLHLMAVYGDGKTASAFAQAWKKSGKKLDMGKSCVRFRTMDDLALDAVRDAIRAVPMKTYVERYRAVRKKTKAGR